MTLIQFKSKLANSMEKWNGMKISRRFSSLLEEKDYKQCFYLLIHKLNKKDS